MAEVLFILVTVYVVYVVHSIVTCKQRNKAEAVATKAQVSVAEIAVKKEPKKTVTEKKKVVEKKPVVKKAPVAKSKAKTNTTLPAGSLRNPETGEVAKIASQYRMTKRWIKDALVTEGLLQKVYKTNEIDDAAKVKIDKALVKLAKMDKYL
jgi:ABC-type anion transport system duplicated permease subunit